MEHQQALAVHERATIEAFVVRERQARFLQFLGNAKTRRKFTAGLGHFLWFDPRFAVTIPWRTDPSRKLWDRHVQGIENICSLLRSKGAEEKCWVISEDADIDGQHLELRTALDHAIGNGMGSILSVLPGKLALYVGEDETLLLSK